MPTDFSTIDRATLNAAQGVMVAALRDRCCQWEQDSADAAAGGNPSAASMIQHWGLLLTCFPPPSAPNSRTCSPRHSLPALVI